MNATQLQAGQKVILTAGFGSTVATVIGHEILRFGHHVELVTEDGERETISGDATEQGIGWRVAA